MKVTIIADDNTGATDAAGMLTSYGAKAVLLMNQDYLDKSEIRDNFDIIVLGTRIRAIEPEEAFIKTAKAVSAVHKTSDLIQLKYCSTFDSTKKGNIGQSIDAARSVISFPSTPVCPALPVNGRTTYMGYHFVWDKILSDSSMRNHPLSPMTDSNLVRWLSYQTEIPVSLIDYTVIEKGVKAVTDRRKELEDKGILYHVTDAVCQENIDIITESYADTGFLTGGSGISASIGRLYFKSEISDLTDMRLKNLGNKTLVISGSDSVTTQKQKETALASGFVLIAVNPYEILDDSVDMNKVTAEASQAFNAGGNIILTVDNSGRNKSSFVKAEGAKKGLSPEKTGEKIGTFLGKAANELTENLEIDRLLVAGGETSGTVCRECGIEALEVGQQIDPGVPYCFPLGKNKPMVVLKSGNFGVDDLFVKTARLS